MDVKSSTPVPPQHVAIVMDGNGRWAEARGKPRSFGHYKGVEAVRRAVRAAGQLGIGYLTLFAFSTENWRRPEEERNNLFELMRHFVYHDLKVLQKEGVCVTTLGSRQGLDRGILDLIDQAENSTRDNNRLHLAVALNYGSRDELVRATRKLAKQVDRGDLLSEHIDEQALGACLDAPDWPDVDLVIRTGGEQRISNFLLWQSAYAEFVFLDIMWPEFDHEYFEGVLNQFSQRRRRFGYAHHDLV